MTGIASTMTRMRSIVAGGFAAGFLSSMIRVNRQNEDVNQSLNQLSQAWYNFQRRVGDAGLNEAIVSVSGAIRDLLSSGTNLQTWFGGIVPFIETTKREFAALAGAIKYTADVWRAAYDFIFGGGQGAPGKRGLELTVFGDAAAAAEPQVSNLATKTDLLVGKMERGAFVIPKAARAMREVRDVFKDASLDLQQYVIGLEQQQAAFGQSEGALARLAKSQDFYNQMQRAGIALTDAQKASVEAWLDRIPSAVNGLEQLKEAGEKSQKAFEDFNRNAIDPMKEAFASIISGSSSVKSAVESMFNSMKQKAADFIASKLFDMILNLFKPTWNGGGQVQLFGGLFSGPSRNTGGLGRALQAANQNSSGNKIIINSFGVPVEQEERRNSSGGKDLIITVNSQIAKQIADPYSYASAPLSARGAKAQVKRR